MLFMNVYNEVCSISILIELFMIVTKNNTIEESGPLYIKFK